jgi:hypothetical protein
VAKIEDRIKTALDEGRMLVLGAQVLLGFQYQSVFQARWEQLPELAQNVHLAALSGLLCALALLLAPAAYHKIVDDGGSAPEFLRFSSRCVHLALLPFAVCLGADLYIAGRMAVGAGPAALLGVCGLLIAAGLWYGGALFRTGKEKEMLENDAPKPASLQEKLDHALTEARMVLPGAQALLGFQFITMLSESFSRLPRTLQNLHLASLALMALSAALLMAPAAFHRIAEGGEYTERAYRFAGTLVLAAMVPLALGLCGDFYIVTWKISGSQPLALGLTGAGLAVFFGLWFGYSLAVRLRRRGRSASFRLERTPSG